jgi:hypothetical protein
MVRSSAHEFFAHQAHQIVAARRLQLRHTFLTRFAAPDIEKIAALGMGHNELHFTLIHNDFADRHAGSLAQFYVDLVTG